MDYILASIFSAYFLLTVNFTCRFAHKAVTVVFRLQHFLVTSLFLHLRIPFHRLLHYWKLLIPQLIIIHALQLHACIVLVFNCTALTIFVAHLENFFLYALSLPLLAFSIGRAHIHNNHAKERLGLAQRPCVHSLARGSTTSEHATGR